MLTAPGELKVSVPRALERTKVHKAMADEYGLELVAYEGGQHVTAPRKKRRDKKLRAILAEKAPGGGVR